MDYPMSLLSKNNSDLRLIKNEEKKKSKEIRLVFYRCKTAKKIVYKWFHLASNKSLNTEVDLIIFSNAKILGPVSKAIEAVKKSNMWGFYRRTNKSSIGEIFFWSSRKCKGLDFIRLFSHEIAHAVGYKSEQSADKIAIICSFSVNAASKHLRSKINIR